MAFLGGLLGGLFGGGGTNVSQTAETKSNVSVGVTTTLNVDTAPLAQAFELWGQASADGQEKIAQALNILAVGEIAQAQASATSTQASLNFLKEVWNKTSRAIVAVGLLAGFYWIFLKKG